MTSAVEPGTRQPVLDRLSTPPWTWRILSIVVVLLVWEIAGRAQPLYASYPTAIATGFYDIAVRRGQVLPALGTTVGGLVTGFLLAAILGNLIGYALGIFRSVEIVLDPYVGALYSVPRIVLVPLLIIALGIGFELRVSIALLSALFPIIINTQAGVRSVDRELLDTGYSFGASRWQRIRTIVVPASLPYVFAGLRIGIVRALGGIIVAEMAAALTGTGALLVRYQRFFQTDKLMGPILVLGLMSIVLGGLVAWVRRRAMPWASREG